MCMNPVMSKVNTFYEYISPDVIYIVVYKTNVISYPTLAYTCVYAEIWYSAGLSKTMASEIYCLC